MGSLRGVVINVLRVDKVKDAEGLSTKTWKPPG